MSDETERIDALENTVSMLIDALDRGLGTAIIETEKAESGEEANVAAIRGLKAIRAPIKKIKNS